MKNNIVLGCIILAFSLPVHSQEKNINSLTLLQDTIPLNPVVRHGVLENGFRYFIMRSAVDTSVVKMQLIVNAGFPNETPEQLGLAHLVEHLAFRATRNFPKGVRTYFIGKGALDIGGNTQWSTNYHLTIPANNEALLDKGLLALLDWASGISFAPQEIEEEKSAVIRELSPGNTPTGILHADLRYKQLNRHPKYKPDLLEVLDNVQTCSRETLLSFYYDYYHPMYQAVIVTGNVDEDRIEAWLKENFLPLSNEGAHSKEDLKPRYSVTLSGEDNVFVVDRGVGSSGIELKIYKKRKQTSQAAHPVTKRDFRDRLMDALVNDMMSYRRKVTRNSPLRTPAWLVERRSIDGGAGLESILLSAEVKHVQEVKPNLLRMFEEMKRVERYGFSETELVRAKGNLSAKIDDNSEVFATEGLRLALYYLEGNAFPQNENLLQLELLNQITLEEINGWITNWLAEPGNTDITIVCPDSHNQVLPKQEEILTWLKNSANLKVSRFLEPETQYLPIIPPGVPVSTCNTVHFQNIDATQVTLPNGATVILKSLPKNSRNRNFIILRALNSKITITQEEHLIASLKDVGLFTRLGSRSVNEVNQWVAEQSRLDHTGLSVYPYIRSGIAGLEGIGNAESVLKLTSLYMLRGAPDKKAYQKYLRINREHSKMKSRSELFNDTIRSTVSMSPNDEFRSAKHNRSSLKEIFKVYRAQFSNAGNFTFIIVGAFKQEDMLALVARYLGAIPGSKHEKLNDFRCTDNRTSFLNEPTYPVIITGDSIGDVNAHLLFRGEVEMNARNKIVLEVLASVVKSVLFKRLREREKGIYSIQISYLMGKSPSEFFMEVPIETAPEHLDRLIAATTDELTKLANGQLDSLVFEHAITTVQAKINFDMNSPGTSETTWASYLVECVRDQNCERIKIDPLGIVNTITPSDIINVIRDNVNINKFMLFKLL